MSRTICQFSCGAASAVATKLVLSEPNIGDVHIINAYIKEEHPDNHRFLLDCQRWFGHPITVLVDQKYGASTHEVFRKRRFFGGARSAAPCSLSLKRELLDAYREPNDVMVLGYTVEESQRFDSFQDHYPEISVRCPLIEKNLTKADCLALVQRAGIELPMMYRLGYENANCIGCVKGGEGYWNKIRRDFPVQFEQMAVIQEMIGPGAYLFRNRKTDERLSLRELKPDAGRHNEPMPSCSFFCEMAEHEM